MACLVAFQTVQAPAWQLVLLATGAVVLAFGAAWSFADWFFLALARWIKDINEARDAIWANRKEMVKAINSMSPDGVKALRAYMPNIITVAGDSGPSHYLDTDGTEMGWIPMQFVQLFIDSGNREKLAAHMLWSDGTDERKWAVTLTNKLILWGYAKDRTNRTATWLEYDGALRSLGLLDEQEQS
jgi:hypothetical protein